MSLVHRLELHAIAAILRRTDLQAGRWRLHRRAMGLVHRHLPAERTVEIRTRDGFRLRVDGSSQTGRVVFATGEYEPGVSRVVRRLAEPGATVIDIGAHIGYFTLLSARLVGPAGRVIAFEPQRKVRAELERNVRLNAFENVDILAVAAFDVRGTRSLHLDRSSTGQASLRDTAGDVAQAVETWPLDDLLPDVEPVLVKIDAEGAEMNILLGMQRLLRRTRPSLVVEVTDAFLRAFGHSADEMAAFLAGIGYTPFLITDRGLEPVGGRNRHAWVGQSNVLFACGEPPL